MRLARLRSRAAIGRVIAAGYIIGLWWWLFHEVVRDASLPDTIAWILGAPLLFLGAPWILLRDDGQVLPLALTYGVAAVAWLATRILRNARE